MKQYTINFYSNYDFDKKYIYLKNRCHCNSTVDEIIEKKEGAWKLKKISLDITHKIYFKLENIFTKEEMDLYEEEMDLRELNDYDFEKMKNKYFN